MANLTSGKREGGEVVLPVDKLENVIHYYIVSTVRNFLKKDLQAFWGRPTESLFA